MRELVIKKCEGCGALVEVLQDCTCENCGIKCCGKEMTKLIPNTDKEKNIPEYEVVGDTIVVSVNKEMDEENFIEWVSMVSDEVVGKKFLKVGKNPKVTFPYVPGSKLYAYCNRHGLWSNEVK